LPSLKEDPQSVCNKKAHSFFSEMGFHDLAIIAPPVIGKEKAKLNIASSNNKISNTNA
jgi:hypothetical protein